MKNLKSSKTSFTSFTSLQMIGCQREMVKDGRFQHLSHPSHYKNDDFYLVKRRFIMANSSFYKSGSM